MTESALIQDLAMMMAIAGLVSVLFAKLKWPKVIGYILAGVLMSRHTWGCNILISFGMNSKSNACGFISFYM